MPTNSTILVYVGSLFNVFVCKLRTHKGPRQIPSAPGPPNVERQRNVKLERSILG